MPMGVNTNIASLYALQSLNKTVFNLDMTQNRVTTGFKVNGPKDDASTYAIAQNMRGDVGAHEAVIKNLHLGQSVVSTAIDGGKAISDILIQMKAKAVHASQASLDANSYTALNDDFTALRAQLNTITFSADFNSTTLISSVATNLQILSTMDGSVITATAASMDATSLVLHTGALTSATLASQTRVLIDTALTNVNVSLASFGSVSKRIDIQLEFTQKLMDITKSGISRLVDADLAAESANLQALQIKQQLGIQALAIANSGPQALLALFS